MYHRSSKDQEKEAGKNTDTFFDARCLLYSAGSWILWFSTFNILFWRAYWNDICKKRPGIFSLAAWWIVFACAAMLFVGGFPLLRVSSWFLTTCWAHSKCILSPLPATIVSLLLWQFLIDFWTTFFLDLCCFWELFLNIIQVMCLFFSGWVLAQREALAIWVNCPPNLCRHIYISICWRKETYFLKKIGHLQTSM